MSGTLGRVEDFDGNKDDWQQYVERLEHFFVANGIDGEEKKRAVFLSPVKTLQAGTVGDRRTFSFQ